MKELLLGFALELRVSQRASDLISPKILWYILSGAGGHDNHNQQGGDYINQTNF